jgi:thioredoxin-related protein
MKYLIAGLILLTNFSAHPQTHISGIQFEQGLTWEKILAKAKANGKGIFVDCYATWCMPCKEMEKFVYNNDTVAQFINDNFISVKVQMDSSKHADRETILLYPAAREFEKKYNITGLPTFLFFSASGIVLHKDVGRKSVSEFISLAKDALNPDKQMYSIVRRAVSNGVNVKELLGTISSLKNKGEDSLAAIVAKRYIDKYLNSLTDEDLLQKEKLEFVDYLGSKAVSSRSKIFRLYYRMPNKIDSIMSRPGYARLWVDAIITTEEILNPLNDATSKGTSPDWNRISKNILRKYDSDYSVYSVLNAKLYWYKHNKEWDSFSATLTQLWKLYSKEFNNYDYVYLNSIAWALVVHRNDKEMLNLALAIINIALSKAPDSEAKLGIMDTRGSILYKLGERDEAVAEIKNIINLRRETSKGTDWDKRAINYYQNLVEDMQQGKPIEIKDN